MQLKMTEEILERWAKCVDYVTLLLLAVSLFLSALARTHLLGEWIEERSRGIEDVALALALAQLLLFVLFSHNFGGDAAALLRLHAKPWQNAVSPEKGAEFAVRVGFQPKWKPLPADLSALEFVSSPIGAGADALLEINLSAFQGTRFEMEREELKVRNEAFLKRDAHVFALVHDPSAAQPARAKVIGFTCVLPLNAAGEDYYLNSVLKDAKVRASLICHADEACSNFLLFAFGLAEEVRKGDKAPYYLDELLKYAGEHAKKIAEMHAGGAAPTVWVQGSHADFEKELTTRGYRKTDKKSGDGFPLYVRGIA